jgi:hypothetical protein
MHTRSGLNASPGRVDSPSSSDDEADAGRDAGRGRGRHRQAVRKISNTRARAAVAVSRARTTVVVGRGKGNTAKKAGQASSSNPRSNLSVKKISNEECQQAARYDYCVMFGFVISRPCSI